MRTILLLCAAVCANAQVRAIYDQIQQGGTNAITDTGGDDAYVGCPTVAITTVQFGTVIILKPSTTNTGAAQLTLNGACTAATLTIVQANGSTLADSTLVVGGANILLADGTDLRFMGTGVTALAALTDAQITSIADKQGLFYDSASSKWKNRTVTTGPNAGLDCTTPYQCDTTAAVAMLANANSWPSLQTFSHLKLPTGTGTLTAGECASSADNGRVKIKTDATSGQQVYVCQFTLSGGWVAQGVSGSITGQTVSYTTERFSKFTWRSDGGTVFPAGEWQVGSTGDVNTAALDAYGPSTPTWLTTRFGVVAWVYDATNDKYFQGGIQLPSTYTNFSLQLVGIDTSAAGTHTMEVATVCGVNGTTDVYNMTFANAITATYTNSGVGGQLNTGVTFTDVVTTSATRTCAAGSMLWIRIGRKAGGTASSGVSGYGAILKFTHSKVQ